MIPLKNDIAERANGILKEEFLKDEEVNAVNIEDFLSRVIGIYRTRRPTSFAWNADPRTGI